MPQVYYCHKCNVNYIEDDHKCASNKYRAVKALVEGITFDSQREASRYCELKILERVGTIRSLERQVVYEIAVNGRHIANYIADFRYIDRETEETVIEDAKGKRLPVYKLKKKLVEAIHNIKIIEV